MDPILHDPWRDVQRMAMNPVMARQLEERLEVERQAWTLAAKEAQAKTQRERLWPDDYLYDEEG